MDEPAVTWGLRAWIGGVVLVGLQLAVTGRASLALMVLALAGLAAAWWTASDPGEVIARVEAHGGRLGKAAVAATAVGLLAVAGMGVGYADEQRTALLVFLVALGGLLAVYGNGPEVDSEDAP